MSWCLGSLSGMQFKLVYRLLVLCLVLLVQYIKVLLVSEVQKGIASYFLVARIVLNLSRCGDCWVISYIAGSTCQCVEEIAYQLAMYGKTLPAIFLVA